MPHKNNEKTSSSRRRGCLVFILVSCGLMAYVIWQVGEPGRRAEEIQKAISPGMKVTEVENLLTGRHICLYQVKTNNQWKSVSRDEFGILAAGGMSNNIPFARLEIHLLGSTPRRASFSVDCDAAGNVTGITRARQWD